ncbi:MAG: hypothetical protein LAO09_14910 [Acidobacteriia bacterium]|nr:hypothetical protein [Terriglobia bacterium]
MAQFTQLGLSGKPEGKPEGKASQNISRKAQHPHSVGNQTVAVFAGALIFTGLIGGLLLETSGCSRTDSKSVIQAPPVSATQQIIPGPAAAPVSVATAQTPVKKVVKKRRPTTVLYSDQATGVSFLYPKKYGLKAVDNTKQEAVSLPYDMNFVQPGGVAVATVELPKGSFPGTDLASASFNVSVNKNVTAEQCGQFTLLQLASTDDLAVQPTRMKLGGLELQEMEAISGSGEKLADAKYYHRFENGTCYEFSLGLSTQPGQSDDVVLPVDREQVFRRLERILATVKITPVTTTTPEVAATAPAPAAPAVAPVVTAPPTQDIAVK